MLAVKLPPNTINVHYCYCCCCCCVTIIIIIVVSCHRPFLPGTSLEPAVIHTAQVSSFTLQYFPYYILFHIIIIIIIMDVSCHRPFLPGTSLEPTVIPTAQTAVSHCSTFLIICDVPSIAIFCIESIKCLPSTASKFFLKLLVTIPVAPIIIGIIVHFRLNIRCISIHKLLYYCIIIIKL